MQLLRVGAHNVAPAEVVLIRTLIRLLSHDRGFPWTFAETQPFDALIVDSTVATPADPNVTSAAGAVLTLTRMNAGQQADTLARPIRPDRLQAWLRGVESRLSEQPPVSTLQSGLPSTLQSALPSTLEALPAYASRRQQASAAAPAERFKLQRWPSTAVLGNDATQLRMATMLSVRPLSIAELAELSHQPLESCRAFIGKLQRAELLGPVAAAPSPAVPAASAMPAPRVAAQKAASASAPASTPAAVRSAPPPSIGRGLIASLRRRLGL